MRIRWGIFAALLGAAALSPAQADAPPIFQAGPSDAAPRTRGAALAAHVKQRFPDLERRYDAFLAGAIDQQTADSWMAQTSHIRAALSPALREEIDGFADVLRLSSASRLGDGVLSLGEFWLFQSAPEFIPMAGGSALGVDGAFTAGGATLAGRVLSGPGVAALGDLMSITVHDHGRGVVVLIGPAGMAGAINGFNAAGLFAALIGGPPEPLGMTPPPPSARIAALDLRQALTDTRSVGAAAKRINRAYGRNHVIFLADRVRARVLESPAEGPARLRDSESSTRLETAWGHPGRIAAVPCFVLARASANCHALGDIYVWRRLREAAAALKNGHVTASDLLRILTDRSEQPYAAFGGDAVAAMVFETGTGAVHLAARDGAGIATPAQRYGALIPHHRRGGWVGFDLIWIAVVFILGAAAAALLYARFKS